MRILIQDPGSEMEKLGFAINISDQQHICHICIYANLYEKFAEFRC
jgi:hypothetical protein